MKPEQSKPKAKAKAKSKAKQKPPTQTSAPPTASAVGPKARQPLVEAGLFTIVRKHSGMGCAIVSLSNTYVRQAVLAMDPLIFLEGIAIQVKPHFDKDTNIEIPEDLFLAWGHKVEKQTPLPASRLVEFFDAKHVELGGEKFPSPPARGVGLQPPSPPSERKPPRHLAGADHRSKQWQGYLGHRNPMPPPPYPNGLHYNSEGYLYRNGLQEQPYQYPAAGGFSGDGHAAVPATPCIFDILGQGASWGTSQAFLSTSQGLPRSEPVNVFHHGQHVQGDDYGADRGASLGYWSGEPDLYMSPAVRFLVEREGLNFGALCIDSDDEQQLSSASSTTDESAPALRNESPLEPGPVSPTVAAPVLDKVGDAVSQKASLTQALSTFPPMAASSLEAWLGQT